MTEQTEADVYDTSDAAGETENANLSVLNDDVIALVNKSPKELVADALDLGIDPNSDEVDQIATLQAANKHKLIDVDFYMVDWQFYEGKHIDQDTGARNVFVRVVFVTVADGKKGFFTDSSKSGICEQIKIMTERRKAAGMNDTAATRHKRVRGGLRVSRYTNKYGEAETFYLNVKDEETF